MISIIVSVYKNLDFLELVLMSLERQKYKEFEVIIAEDANENSMKEFIKNYSMNSKLKITLVSQEDIGFRKNKILNKAIFSSLGDKLIFIDGDCVLHKNFIFEYAKRLKNKMCYFGRRAHPSKRITEKLISTKKLVWTNIFILLLTSTRRKEEVFYIPWVKTTNRKEHIYGCNFGVMKSDLFEINGFDEDYEGPYFGEDTDLEMRLRKNGVKFECIKHKAVQYHLYHSKGDRKKDWENNEKLYNDKNNSNIVYCLNGIDKYSLGEKIDKIKY